MGTEQNFNISSTELVNWANSTTTKLPGPVSDLEEENSKWTEEEIAELIQLIVRPIIIVFGTIGNMLSFYIMRSTSLKESSSCFYMSILALTDTRKCTFIL